MARLLRTLALAVLALSISACTSTELVQLWRDPNYRAQPVKRIFVIAEIQNPAYKTQFENALAQALTAKGFQAATATSVFPPGPLDKYAVANYIEGNGVDLVIRMRLTKQTTTEVVPATVTYASGWYGGGVAYSSGYVSEETNVACETGVFNVKADPEILVWVGKSATTNVQGAYDASQSFAKALVEDLVKAGILVK
jgi:hypothetical protein